MFIKTSFCKKISCCLVLLASLFCGTSVFAQEFSQDLSVSPGSVQVAENILVGDTIRIYVTVHNNSDFDLSGVVKFYDEKTSGFIASDQPISVLANKTDDVFIDWATSSVGEHPIAIRVVPWETDGDNPDNNKVTKPVYIDTDSDGDGTGDRLDQDDDNDGVPDIDDAFPLDPNESLDTDGDGIGDNADIDDDGDGVPDAEDAFPLDSNESKDTDKDGTGDNSDIFPYDSSEWMDSDGDGIGDNADPNDENHSPVPFIEMSETKVQTGKELTFNAIKSRDPDGEIIKYEWNFGDGVDDTGVIVSHKYEKSGEYIVTLNVTDDLDESRVQQVQVKVTWGWLTIILIISTLLLVFLLLGMFIPRSRFHHSKLFKKPSLK